MSWSPEITHPTLPKINETISSFRNCRGNIVTCVKDLGYPALSKIEDSNLAMEALSKMIEELDKGDDGVFSDIYIV